MYKGFQGTYDKIDISSIVQGHPDFTYNHHFHAFTQYCYTVFWIMIRDRLGGKLAVNYMVKHIFSTSKAGPAHASAMLGAPRDAFVWFNPDKETGISSNYILEWLEETGDERLKKIFSKAAWAYEAISLWYGETIPKVNLPVEKKSGTILSREDGAPEFIVEDRRSPTKTINKDLLPTLGFGRLTSREDETPRILGRLSPIYEAAGKIRVVAIIDYWTNVVLKPLHDWMFDILRCIPTDATFDQEGTLNDFVKKGYKECWSIDLTAATDTIPIALYQSLLIPIIGVKMTELWSKLLIGRNFLHRFAPKSERDFTKGDSTYDLVRYQRGQPMGALSSWPAMALVHHALVQYSSYTVDLGAQTPRLQFEFLRTATPREVKYLPWFEKYLILGDDLVIFDTKVAERYLEISEALGLKVGMTKSFISSKGFVNFASQSFVDDKNLSPISFKQFIGVKTLYERVSMTRKLIERGWIDISTHKWLKPLVTTFLNNERPWKKIQEFYYKGKVHPIIPWVLSALLVPGRAISSIGITRVSIRAPLSFLKSGVIWNKPIDDLKEGTMECMSRTTIDNNIFGSLDEIDRLYTDARENLSYFDSWLSRTMSPESYELLRIILYDQVKERLDKWAARNRIPLSRVRDRLIADQPPTGNLKWEEITKLLDLRAKYVPPLCGPTDAQEDHTVHYPGVWGMIASFMEEPTTQEILYSEVMGLVDKDKKVILEQLQKDIKREEAEMRLPYSMDPLDHMGTDDIITYIQECHQTIPTVPNYKDPSYLMEPLLTVHPDRNEEFAKYSHFLSSLGIAEHLYSFLSPGFDRSIMTNQSKCRKPTSAPL
jgi:hypothetical protein